jgi:hypothetical protein
VKTNYGVDILRHEHDSLEEAMAILYSDMFNPQIGDDVYSTFRNLVRLFNGRLSTTTNAIVPNQRSSLYRMVSWMLSHGFASNQISFVTFNQDIQIERTLFELSRTKRYRDTGVFSFPSVYSLGDKQVTGPPGGGIPLFPEENPEEPSIHVYKLHGSLNWYSQHTTLRMTRRALFNEKRKFSITRRRDLAPETWYKKGTARKLYAFPVVVPPVTHKSGVLQQDIRDLWTKAEQALKQADAILIFGYSCPPADFESANMFSRCLRRVARDGTDLYLVDPDPAVLARYADLTGANKIYYYSSASAFLGNIDDDLGVLR